MSRSCHWTGLGASWIRRVLSIRFSIGLALAAAAVPAVVASGDARAEGTGVPAQGYVWKNVKVMGGGAISRIFFSPRQPGVAYCRTDLGGAYRWDNQAKRWIPLTDWNPVPNQQGTESIALDPSDTNRLYLAQGTGPTGPAAILRSMDQGKTFETVEVPFRMGSGENGRGLGERLAVDPNDNKILYFGSRYSGLWVSKDAGRTWTAVKSYPVTGSTDFPFIEPKEHRSGVSFVVFDAASGTPGKPTPAIYAGSTERTPFQLYRSLDAGKTWQPVRGEPKGKLLPVQAEFDAQGTLYVVYNDVVGPDLVAAGGLWKFEPKSGVWTDISPVKDPKGAPAGCGAFALDVQKPGTLMASSLGRNANGEDERLYRTTDGGKTWKDISEGTRRDSSPAPYLNWGGAKPSLGWWITGLAIDPFDSKHVCYGTGATLWSCGDIDNADADKDTHWSICAEGIEAGAVLELMSPSAGPHLISGFADIGTFTHDDFDVSPRGGMQAHPLFASGTVLDFAEKNPSLMIRGGSKSMRVQDRGTLGYSTDGGKTWTPFTIEGADFGGGKAAGFGAGSGPVMLSADGSTILSAVGAVQVSRDRGRNWTPSKGLPPGVRPVADRFNPAKFYAVSISRGKVYRSKDGGAVFTPVDARGMPDPESSGRFILRSAPGREGDLWLVSQDGVFHSLDGGESFSSVAGAPSVVTMGFGLAAPGKDYPSLFVAGACQGQQGIFRSDDAGASWVRINDDAHRWGNHCSSIAGDPRVYGRVYVGTGGRGVWSGDIAQ